MKGAGVEVHELHLTGPLSMLRGLRRARAIARAAQPVAIQAWMTHANVFASLLRLSGVRRPPLFWGVRQSFDFTGERLRTRVIGYASAVFARVPTAIVYNSETGARQHEAIGYPRAKRRLIPNGFDLEKYRLPVGTREAMRSQLGLDTGEVVVGLIGRVHPVKNHRGFLAAAAIIARELPNVRFLMAGRGASFDDEAFAAMVASAGVEPEKLRLLGEQADVSRAMSALDIAANVSFAESFPNVVGEAMAYGVPCLVTPVGDSARILGNTGIVASGTSGEAIADAVRVLIGMGEQGRAALATRAAERVRQHYSLSRVVLQFERLYGSTT
jgi:glycosyltransferase involved in cell wall biosynthesis